MTDQTLTDKAELLTPDGADWLHTVDVDDLASSPEGTSKKVSYDTARTKIISDSDTDDLSEGSTNLYNVIPAGGDENDVVVKNSAADRDLKITKDLIVSSVGIGGAPDATALLDVQSTTRGVLIPRMTHAEKTAIVSPPDSMLVYDTNQEAINYRIEGIWDRRRVLSGQSLILPTHPGIEPDDIIVSSDATLKGGLYRTDEAIKFNRIYFSIDTYAAGRTFRFLIYQDQDGDGIAEKICTVEDFDPGATGIQIVTPTEDPVILLPSLDIVVLWGEDGPGDIKLFCHKNKQINLYNSSTELFIGQIPTTFTTTIASTTSPASVDPRFGGADGFVGSDDSDTLPVLRFNYCVPFSIRQAIYSGLSFDLSSEDTSTQSAQFNADGTAMFILGSGTDAVYQYTLTTGFDVSTASYDAVSFSVSSEASLPKSFAFNPAGTKMFVLDGSTNDIFQYTLGTGFDMSTASYDTVSFSVTSEDTAPGGIAFNPAGTKMFIVGNVAADVFQYTLSSGFDLTTASYDTVSFPVDEDADPMEVKFNPAGTTMIILGGTNDDVFQYTLTVGFDLTTASYDSISFSVASEDTNAFGITYSTDGETMFMVGGINDDIFQYSLC